MYMSFKTNSFSINSSTNALEAEIETSGSTLKVGYFLGIQSEINVGTKFRLAPFAIIASPFPDEIDISSDNFEIKRD
jgi:hypothetical protein